MSNQRFMIILTIALLLPRTSLTVSAQWFTTLNSATDGRTGYLTSSTGTFRILTSGQTELWDTTSKSWTHLSDDRLTHAYDSALFFRRSDTERYVSYDLGRTLRRIVSTPDHTDLAFLYAKGDTVIASNIHGLWITSDCGKSPWQRFVHSTGYYGTFRVIDFDTVVAVVARLPLTPGNIVTFTNLNGELRPEPMDSLITDIYSTIRGPILLYNGRPTRERFTNTLGRLSGDTLPDAVFTYVGNRIFAISNTSRFLFSDDDAITWREVPGFHVREPLSFQYNNYPPRLRVHAFDDSVRIEVINYASFISDTLFTSWTVQGRSIGSRLPYRLPTFDILQQDTLVAWYADNLAIEVTHSSSNTSTRVITNSGPKPVAIARTSRGSIIKMFARNIQTSSDNGTTWNTEVVDDTIVSAGSMGDRIWRIGSSLHVSDDDGTSWFELVPGLLIHDPDSVTITDDAVMIVRRNEIHLLFSNEPSVITHAPKHVHIMSLMRTGGSTYLAIDSSIYRLVGTHWLFVESLPRLHKKSNVCAVNGRFYAFDSTGRPVEWEIGGPPRVIPDHPYLASAQYLNSHVKALANMVLFYSEDFHVISIYDPSPTTSTPWIRFSEPVRQNYRLVAHDNIVDVHTDPDTVFPDGPTTVYSTLGSAHSVTVSHGQFSVEHLPRGMYILSSALSPSARCIHVLVP